MIMALRLICIAVIVVIGWLAIYQMVRPNPVAWYNVWARKEMTPTRNPTFMFRMDGKDWEIGVRSDGVVVAREIKK